MGIQLCNRNFEGRRTMRTFLDYGITFNPGSSGEIKTICPQCSGQRKKKNYPCLNVNIEKGVWHCWHCDWSGTLREGVWREPQYRKPDYQKPRHLLNSPISEEWKLWLNNRGISEQTMKANQLANGMVYMPQIEAEIDAIRFPFIRNGEIINCKYRDKNKNFRMAAGAERLLYGFDDIESECLVWVEGEMDKLSLYEAGLKSCVSVPDGAPSPKTKNYSSKFDYFESSMERLSTVKQHIIAVDNDEPGMKLQSELVRRLGPEKCALVNWPSDCKDANEVLCKYGEAVLVETIEQAKPVPIEGLFNVTDAYEDVVNLYQNGVVGGAYIGWENMRDLYSVRPGDFTVITGIPGHGKSEWTDAVMVNLAKLHGWRFAVFSPENQPISLHIKKLAEKWISKPFFKGIRPRMTLPELNQATEELNKYFDFVLPESPTLDALFKLIRVEVLRRGINGALLDPWNELEHSRPSHQSETEYISDSLRKMRQFARQNNIALWVIAHPTKMQRIEKGSTVYEVPTPYDIAGSANWRNKADNCVTVYRANDCVEVYIQKIRVKEIGRIGVAKFSYDIETGEYTPIRDCF